MATKPTDKFTYATDANFSTGPDSGNPTKANPPGYPAVVQGEVPGLGVVAAFTNKIRNVMGQWTQWLDAGSSAGAADAHIVETDSAGKTTLEEIEAKNLYSYTSRTVTRIGTLALNNLYQGTFEYGDSDDWVLSANAAGGDVIWLINSLPHNCEVDEIRLHLKGASGHTAGTMTTTPPELIFQRYITPWGAMVDIANVFDTDVTATYESLHTLTLSSIGYTTDCETECYACRLNNETGGDQQAGLSLYAFEVDVIITEQSEWNLT